MFVNRDIKLKWINHWLISLFLLLILMILLSFAEAISLASIVPFIGVFLDPEIFFSNPKFNFFINFFNIENKEEIFLPIT